MKERKGDRSKNKLKHRKGCPVIRSLASRTRNQVLRGTDVVKFQERSMGTRRCLLTWEIWVELRFSNSSRNFIFPNSKCSPTKQRKVHRFSLWKMVPPGYRTCDISEMSEYLVSGSGRLECLPLKLNHRPSLYTSVGCLDKNYYIRPQRNLRHSPQVTSR